MNKNAPLNFAQIKNSIEASVKFYDKFKLLVEKSNEVFWVAEINDTDHVVYISPAFAKLWGYDPSEIYANPKSWFDAVYLEDKDKLIKSLEDLRKGIAKHDLQYRIKTKTGETAWVHATADIVVADNQKMLIGIANDITELKQKEQEIQRLKNQIKARAK